MAYRYVSREGSRQAREKFFHIEFFVCADTTGGESGARKVLSYGNSQQLFCFRGCHFLISSFLLLLPFDKY